ncbi:hypothetical protein GM538_13815, partial [Streptococcus pneumoniae]|uniref:hypothetical protein n=1 Tax=Streptococcus pneumoniae TaxID=1313 RepID=UPI0012D797C2
VDEGVKRYRELVADATNRGEAALLKPVERLMLYWLAPTRKSVASEVRAIRRGTPGAQRQFYGPVLHLVDPSVSAAIALREV